MSEKKLIVLLICIIVFSFAALPAAAKPADSDFPDIPSGWSREVLVTAIENGLIDGIDGKLAPKAYLTRAQLAVIVNRAFNVTKTTDISDYIDVNPEQWFYEDMSKAVCAGYMSGSRNRLHPFRDVTREEVFTVLARAMNVEPFADTSILNRFSDSHMVSPWAKGYVAAMVKKSYMFASNNKLEPKMKITREEFAYVICQILNDMSN